MTQKSSYEHGQFSWVDLSAIDLRASSEWYAQLFGWDFELTHPTLHYGMFTLEGKNVCGLSQLGEEMREAGVRPVWNSYVKVDDAQAVAAKVSEAGGEVRVAPLVGEGLGTIAFFCDPEGASFAVWQPGPHAGAQVVNEAGAFTWNELLTRAVDGAGAFYGSVFGWSTQEQPMPDGSTYTLFKNGDAMNAGAVTIEPGLSVPPHWLVYFQVTDIESCIATIKDTGGAVQFGPLEIPQGQIATVSDPQGAVFGLIQASG